MHENRIERSNSNDSNDLIEGQPFGKKPKNRTNQTKESIKQNQTIQQSVCMSQEDNIQEIKEVRIKNVSYNDTCNWSKLDCYLFLQQH